MPVSFSLSGVYDFRTTVARLATTDRMFVVKNQSNQPNKSSYRYSLDLRPGLTGLTRLVG